MRLWKGALPEGHLAHNLDGLCFEDTWAYGALPTIVGGHRAPLRSGAAFHGGYGDLIFGTC